MLSAVREMILPHVEVDCFAAALPGHQYTVRSLYFDTAGLAFYHQKLAGVRRRVKVRIRGYNELSPTEPVFLEVKRKVESVIEKTRASLAYQDLPALFETGDVDYRVCCAQGEEEARKNARQFLYLVHHHVLHPVVLIEYDREPYVSRHDSSVRITIDKNLRSHLPAGTICLNHSGQCIMADPRRFILEVKTDAGIPVWMRLILNRLNATHQAASKYTICIDSLRATGLRPDLIYPLAMRVTPLSTQFVR